MPNRSTTSASWMWSLSVLIGACALPVTAGAQEADNRLVLRSAEIGVEVLSPVAARVRAAYEIVGPGNPVLQLARFPGQTLSEVAVEVNRAAVPVSLEPTAGPALVELRLPELAAGAHDVRVRYSVDGTGEHAYRYPVAVPRGAGQGSERTVTMRVVLPAGNHATGDSFPALRSAAGAGELAAELLAVPSFVHLVFAPRPPRLGLASRLELLTLLLVLAPAAVLLLRWWRREERR